MRRVIFSLMIGVVVLAWSGMVRADDPVQAGVQANVQTQADPNMRWHNNRWWYWQPNQNHWMAYHNNQWIAPNASGAYLYNGQSIFGNNRYYSGYRGYGNGYYGNGYYGNGYYGNGYYGNGYGNGYYGNGFYGNNQGANAGAAIGGALGGNQGANVGAAIGGALGRRR